MAPGLNGCQSEKNPKNKSKTRSRPAPREVVALANLQWEPVLESDNRRNQGFTYTEPAADQLRINRVPATSGNLVDNDNGELSWGLDQFDSPGSSVRPLPRRNRQKAIWMSSEQPSGSSSSNGAAGNGRNNPPNRLQVVSKLSSIQDYIEQTEMIMRELRASDTPGCMEQHDKLAGMLMDLRDSENKLQLLLRSMDNVDAKIDKLLNVSSQSHINGDGPTEEELHRKTAEHNRKVEALEKQRQELIELQQIAQRKLAEAEAERVRLLNRATSFNTDAIAGTSLEANLQSLTERLRNVQRVRDDQGRPDEAIEQSMQAEHPDEEQVEGELSDTETDYQLVRDKVAELNAMKAQLTQLQNVMAAIETDRDGSEDDGRRSQSREMQKVERMVGQIQELNRLVESVRNCGKDEVESECVPQQDQQRMSEEVTVETMQQMTRDLEEQTARMKRERDALLQARNNLQNMARLARARASSSAEDSESEPPSLLPANLVSTPRNVEEDSASRSGGRKSNDSGTFRAPPRVRQRSTWNQSLPTLVNVNQDTYRRRKEPRSSQSSLRNGESGSRNHTEPSNWSPDLLRPEALYQTQRQLEASAQLCEQMLQDSVGHGQTSGTENDAELTSLLYSQQQMLTRTVSHCCKLIWLQQRQINELHNTLILQQTANMPSQAPIGLHQPMSTQSGAFACNHPTLFSQVREVPVNGQPPKTNEAAGVFFEPNMPIPPQNAPNPGFDPYLQDYHYRSRGFTLNAFGPRPVNADMGIAGPSTAPPMPPVMACFSPDGALNNQVPPGNRANNYWDNFRSYSRQNLLSTKSNENLDPLRRGGQTRQTANQERTPHAIVPPNNQSQNPVGEVQPLRQITPDAVSSNPVPHASNHDPIRSRPPEPQNSRNLGVKNRTCEVPARREDASDGSRGRNNTGLVTRNRVTPEQWPSGNQEVPDDSLPRLNNTGTMWRDKYTWLCDQEDPYDVRPRNNTNRTRPDPWQDLRENPEEGLTRVRNNTGGAHNRNRTEQRSHPWEMSDDRNNADDVNRVRNNTGIGGRSAMDPSAPPPECPDNRWNNRAEANNSQFSVLRLPTTVYQEVSNFIRANEARPNFLIQLFRDLQQVTSDMQRQRALQSLQEVVLDARSNIRHEHRSNLNRYSNEAAVDQLFEQLRENQNTIRQNIGNVPLDTVGNNLENPIISNIRELLNPSTANPVSQTRNDLDLTRLRDMQSYFEGNLCNLGPGSSLKNPNLSNIRENLTLESLSEYERMNPKNVYLSLYDSLVEDLRRRAEDDMPVFGCDDISPMYMNVSAGYAVLDRQVEEEMEQNNEEFRNEPRELDAGTGGAIRKRVYRFPNMNEGRGEELSNERSLSEQWRPTDNPSFIFVRPMNQLGGYQEAGILQTDDADLAEADQSRSAEGSEFLSSVINRLTVNLNDELQRNPLEQESAEPAHEDEREQAELQHSTDVDPDEAAATHENNSNVSKTFIRVKNQKDASIDSGVKVTKTRLQEALSAAAEPERPEAPITPMMDMAGALEHLIDYRRPLDESSPYHQPDSYQEVDVQAEREAGLDQVPTRLERCDSPGAERENAA